MMMDDGTMEWAKATAGQIRELARLRRAVSKELVRLRRALRHGEAQEKEGHFAEIMRLSQVQMKLIPMEQALRRDMAEIRAQSLRSEATPLEEADWRILEAAILRRRADAPVAGQAASHGAGGETARMD